MSLWNVNITCPRCFHVGDVELEIEDCAPPAAPLSEPEEVEREGEKDPRRWESGFRRIVSIVVGPHAEFEIPEIVEKVRDVFTVRGAVSHEEFASNHLRSELSRLRQRVEELEKACEPIVRQLPSEAECDLLDDNERSGIRKLRIELRISECRTLRAALSVIPQKAGGES